MKKLTLLVAALCATMFASAARVTVTLTDWNTTFGTSYSGQITDVKTNPLDLTGNVGGVSVNVKSGTSTSGYIKATECRFYSGYTLSFTAPTDSVVTKIVAAKGGKTITGFSVDTGKVVISDAGDTLVWEGNSNVVTFSVTATTSLGSIEITYGSKDEKTAVTGVSLNATEKTIEIGESITLEETVSPSDATDKSVTWSSSAEGIATVTKGVVTGVAAGSATITVTTTDGGQTATCAITVVAATPSEYVETPIENIKSEDEVVITMVDSLGVVWALGNPNSGTANATATKMRVVENSIKVVNTNMIFTMSYDSGAKGVVFTVKDGSDYLYASATKSGNNNSRIGVLATGVNAWNVVDGYLKSVDYEVEGANYNRYLGVYTGTDYRAYTSVADNIKKQTVRFYVKSVGGEKVIPETPTAIESLEVAPVIYGANGMIYGAEEAHIYSISGMDVTEMNGSLRNGVYVVKVNGKAHKVVVK